MAKSEEKTKEETLKDLPKAFQPAEVWSGSNSSGGSSSGSSGSKEESKPRMLISPARYIQGPQITKHLGRYLTALPSKSAALLLSKGGKERFGKILEESLIKYHIEFTWLIFQGECSYEEVLRLKKICEESGKSIDSIVSVGGGKTIDAGKCLAAFLHVKFVSFPTIASNDAPCSALSVMYHPDGRFKEPRCFPSNPDLVVVDSESIAHAPVRYLVAGIGDAMSTYYEARCCYENEKAVNMIGTRPTLTSLALGELCCKILYESGVKAREAVIKQQVTKELEMVIEANTLLSGVGFESGGLACAHAIAQALTASHNIESKYMHGEMVAAGVMGMLVMEKKLDEARKCGEFFCQVGLPCTYSQLGLDTSANDDNKNDISKVLDAVMSPSQPFRDNEPFPVTRKLVLESMRNADKLGADILQHNKTNFVTL